MKIYTTNKKKEARVLHTPSTKINRSDKLPRFSMRKFLTETKHLGLALPQIWINKRWFVARVWWELKTFINPELIIEESLMAIGKEWCLSTPYKFRNISRYVIITIQYQDLEFEEHYENFTWMDARIIQHEHDHLLGKLITDVKDRKPTV